MNPWQPHVLGESGRVWVVDKPQGSSGVDVRGHGRFYYGWPEDDPDARVWVQCAQGALGGEIFGDDRGHLRAAYRCSRLPSVERCEHVVRVLDIAEFGDYETYLFQELASRTLKAAIGGGYLPAGEFATAMSNVALALDAIHAAGYVHCDVREDNILDVGGTWKLGDLGASTREGAPMLWGHRDRAYAPAGVEPDGPADTRNDRFALDYIATRARPVK